jgi:carbamoyl-phosphate synthase large subunit
LPPQDAAPAVLDTLTEYTRRIGLALPVKGLMNIQYAVREDTVYALEVNPRASRTVPFVSKTVGVPLARLGALVMVGQSLAELGLVEDPVPLAVAVKAPALPFEKFPGVDPVLGPEMKSTGEVIGLSEEPYAAYRKAMLGTGVDLHTAVAGPVFLSLAGRDLEEGSLVAKRISEMGAEVRVTEATRSGLARHGLRIGGTANVVGDPAAEVRRGDFSLVVSTPRGSEASLEDVAIRRAALWAGVPCMTSIEAARAAVAAVESSESGFEVCSLQRWEARPRC